MLYFILFFSWKPEPRNEYMRNLPIQYRRSKLPVKNNRSKGDFTARKKKKWRGRWRPFCHIHIIISYVCVFCSLAAITCHSELSLLSVRQTLRSSFLSSFAAAAFLPKIGRHATPRVNRACVKKVLPSPASLSLERMQHPVHVLERKDFSKICQLSRFLFLSAAHSFSLPFFPLSCLLFLRVSLRMSWLGKQFINSLLPWFLFTKKAQKKNTRPTSAP